MILLLPEFNPIVFLFILLTHVRCVHFTAGDVGKRTFIGFPRGPGFSQGLPHLGVATASICAGVWAACCAEPHVCFLLSLEKCIVVGNFRSTQIPLTLEKHGFEPHRSTYTQIFKKINIPLAIISPGFKFVDSTNHELKTLFLNCGCVSGTVEGWF